MKTQYLNANRKPITKAQKNQIQERWDSFYPGHPGFTYTFCNQQKVVRIDPNTKEEHTQYWMVNN